VVCSSQRSGSSLLCQALADTQAVGTPTEYFNPRTRAALTERWRCGGSVADYVATARARRSSPGGLFGTKLHWDQFEQLRAEVLELTRAEPEFEISSDFLEELLPRPLYIHILRRDVNRQAVSFWRALSTGVWSELGATPVSKHADAAYSFEGIDRCKRLIENAELHWDRFFRFNGITPLEVVYEDLESGYEQTVGAVLRQLAPRAGEVTVAEPRTQRLRDERSLEMLERFAHDRVERGLDNPLVPAPATAALLSERERELGRLLSSRSWRLTRPLRELRAIARRA
jgi:trehalose 2-sulfotransferase